MPGHRLLPLMLILVGLEGVALGVAYLVWGVWGLVGAIALVLMVGDLPFSWLLDRGSPVRVGKEALLGSRARVISPFPGEQDPGTGRGAVRAHGALWSARLAAGADRTPRQGEYVRIHGMEGLTLVVAPEP